MNTMYVHRLTKEESTLLIDCIQCVGIDVLNEIHKESTFLELQERLKRLIEKLEHPEIRMK